VRIKKLLDKILSKDMEMISRLILDFAS